MKLTTAKTLRHGPSPYEQYTEKNPELTRIKAAENFTRINGMMDFYKRTSWIVIAAAGLLLVVSLVAVGLVFNADGVKDILLELFNKIIGA